MEDELCSVIVYGLNELASAVACRLRLIGHAVAVHEAKAPNVLCRKKALSDAWYDGMAVLDGMEMRRADNNVDFINGMRGTFIPLLIQPLSDVMGRWPWDVVIDARTDIEPRERRIHGSAELTIALGPGAVAGVDCDLVIETVGPDPGGVIRSGSAHSIIPMRLSPDDCIRTSDDGVFQTRRVIGEMLAAGDVLGRVAGKPVLTHRAGRLCGLQRSPRFVRSGDTVGQFTSRAQDEVSGIDRKNRLIARSVAFTIGIELNWPAMRFESLNWRSG